MHCPSCGFENPEETKFCGACGSSLTNRCPSCRAENPPPFKFCGECVLFGLWRFYFGRRQLHTARELGETLLRLVQQAQDPAFAVIAHYALGATWLFLGALPAARQHLEAGIALYTPDQRRAPVFHTGQDPGVACRAYAAWTLWLLGYPEQALARLRDALVLARDLSHPYSLAFARAVAGMVSQWRRDVPAPRRQER